jgi:biopolymer transport protein TolR
MKPIIEPAPTVTRINVTPIIDVALVLVIILLITAPILVATDLEVELPEALTRGLEDEVRVSITVNKEGEIAVEDSRVLPDQLEFALRARMAQSHDKDVLVIVRADAQASHETVRRILRDAREAGAKRLAIATRQRRGGQS